MEEIVTNFFAFVFEWSALLGSAGILIWFDSALPKFKNYIKENPFGEYEQPRTAVTLGVLGTFVGIVAGLFSFNPEQNAIQQSVINLLGGMRTAFVTSILGMVISMYLKNLQANAQKNFPQSEINAAATVADLIDYLKKSDAEKSAATQNLFNAVEKMTNSLAGDGDYTVIGQMKTIRLELRDHHEKIISEFREFAKTLAENNTKAFIEALNDAIKDFNTKITEQFGENFKQLNIAVGRLLEWQENYKSTLERVTENLEMTFEGIDAAKNSLAQIESSSAAVADTAAAVQDLIVTANLYAQKLEQVLAEVKALGDSAKNAVPQIINLVENSCSEMQKSTATAANNINDLSDEIHIAIGQAQEFSEQISETANDAFSEFDDFSRQAVQSMQEVSKRIETTSYKQREIMDAEIQATKDAVQKTTANIENEIFKITKTVANSMHKLTEENIKDLQATSKNLSADLTQKMNDCLTNFGKAMNLVSNQFVKDYTPLTQKLALLINIAKDAERRVYVEKT